MTKQELLDEQKRMKDALVEELRGQARRVNYESKNNDTLSEWVAWQRLTLMVMGVFREYLTPIWDREPVPFEDNRGIQMTGFYLGNTKYDL